MCKCKLIHTQDPCVAASAPFSFGIAWRVSFARWSGFEPRWSSNVFFRLSPLSFYVVCFLSVDVSVPVRQVKLPLVAHSSLSRARPGSMVGATLNEESADQFVETFLVRDVSTLFYPILFMCPSWGIFKTWGRVLLHLTMLWSHSTGLSRVRPLWGSGSLLVILSSWLSLDGWARFHPVSVFPWFNRL